MTDSVQTINFCPTCARTYILRVTDETATVTYMRRAFTVHSSEPVEVDDLECLECGKRR